MIALPKNRIASSSIRTQQFSAFYSLYQRKGSPCLSSLGENASNVEHVNISMC